MKKLYEKSELWFSLVWIIAYVLWFSIAEDLSKSLGTEKIITAPLTVLFALALWLWVRGQGLQEKYGLCRFRGNLKDCLYFLPLVLIAGCNLWNGVRLNFSPAETALYILSMLLVGFIEEMIFRGFLFKAIEKDNVKKAMIISSLTFGLGHIVNLLNGAELVPTLLQICYAVSLGFLFTLIFYKGKSLLPCIATHSLLNSLSVFAVEGTAGYQMAVAAALFVLSLGYALWIARHCK